jgi:hypothetical protein
MSSLSPDQLGTFVLGIGALLGFLASAVAVAAGFKKLIEAKPSAEQAITRAESNAFATRAELQKVKEDVLEIKNMIDKQQSYMQSRFHELANQLAPMPTQIAVLLKQQEKLETKLDDNSRRQDIIIQALQGYKPHSEGE